MSESSGSGSPTKRHPLPSGLLHDLRTPLNHIIGYSELLIEEAQGDGVGHLPFLLKVRAAAHHMAALITENFEANVEPAEPFVGVAPPEAREATADPEPRLAARSERRAASERASAAARGSLLVIDEDEESRDVLARRLTDYGYAVAAVGSGEQALELLRDDTFDVILLDILMSEPEGFEVLRMLKADERLKHLSVIVTSSLADVDSVARSLELGAEDYLITSFDSTLLHARVEASVDRKRARDRERYLTEQLRENFERLKALERKRVEGSTTTP